MSQLYVYKTTGVRMVHANGEEVDILGASGFEVSPCGVLTIKNSEKWTFAPGTWKAVSLVHEEVL